MSKLTLLEIVQDILSDMSSDEVNSIHDTIESEQVARIVRSAYRDMMANKNWPHLKRLAKLIPYSDSELPTHMKFDDDIKELVADSMKYDKAKNGVTRKLYTQVKWMENDDFIRYIYSRNSDDTDKIRVVKDPTGVELLIRRDVAPTYFTSFDDTTLVFDSYDEEVDATLQSSKIMCMAYFSDKLDLIDTAVPNIPQEAFASLVNESLSRASFNLDDEQNVKAEAEANRQNRWLSQKAWRASDKQLFPRYGKR